MKQTINFSEQVACKAQVMDEHSALTAQWLDKLEGQVCLLQSAGHWV